MTIPLGRLASNFGMQPLFASFTERGGLFRRTVALLIDIVVVGIVLHLIGAIAYQLTNGYLQTEGVITFSNCTTRNVAPSGLAPEFHANSFSDCRHTLFGLESGHTLRVSRVERIAGASSSVAELRVGTAYSLRLDRDGRLVGGIGLDFLLLPFLVLYRIGFEYRFAAGLGKWIVQQRVVDRTTRGPAWPDNIVRRNLIFALPVAPFVLLQLWPITDFAQSMLPWILLFTPIGCMFAAAAVAMIQMAAGHETFYDGRAGTTVFQKPL